MWGKAISLQNAISIVCVEEYTISVIVSITMTNNPCIVDWKSTLVQVNDAFGTNEGPYIVIHIVLVSDDYILQKILEN